MKMTGNKINKNRMIIFVGLAFFVVAISLFFAFKGKDNWTTQGYSITSDDQISITDETDIELKFEISEDNFQGITIRISPKETTFGNEKLKFVMTDQESGNLIAEYSMDLKSEVFRSNSFVRLPYENSKGKKVSVHIEGIDIHHIPQLYVSNQFENNTKMYVDGTISKNVLVFSGVYMTKTEINYQSLVKGGMILALLILVLFWPFHVEVNQKENLLNTKRFLWLKNCMKTICNLLHKHKKCIMFIGLSCFYFIFLVFVYKTYVSDMVWGKKSKVIVKNVEDADSIILNRDTEQWEQNFYVSRDELSSLLFKVKVRDYASAAKIHVKVYDGEKNICYHDKYVKVKKIAENPDAYWKILLEKEFTKSQNQSVVIIMEPVDFANTVVEFEAGMTNQDNYLLQNGEYLSTVPALQVYYKDNGFLKPLFVIFSVMGYLFLLLVFYLFVIKRAGVKQAFIPVTLTLGILYMFAVPVYSVPDEYTHIDSAYIISNRMLGIAPENSYGYEYKRTIDIETEEAPEYNATLSDYRRLYTSFFEMADDQSLSSCYVNNALPNANVLCYLPAAIGITIARLLGLGTLQLFYLGRLMNLIAFTLLVYFAICKLPGGRHIVMLYTTLPIVLQEAASFAYDGMINACSVIFVSYCLYFAFDKGKKSLPDIFILLGSLLFMASVKGGVYLPMCLLIFLIPIEQNWRFKTHGRYLLGMTFCILASFMQNNITWLLNRIFVKGNRNINPFTGKEMYTIPYLVKHPLKLISLYVNTFFADISQWIYEFFGGKMGSMRNIQMPWIYVLIFMVIMGIAIASKDFDGKVRSHHLVVRCGCIAFASVLLLCLSMLIANTLTEYDLIKGVQGRYFIPCMLSVMLVTNYCLKSNRTVDHSKIKLIYYLTQIIFLFQLFIIVIS